MRLRKKRCLLISITIALSFTVWKLIKWPNNLVDDETALSALEPRHFAEDSRKGILYHHKFHDGIANFHISNDTWVRDLLKPFDQEIMSAASEVGVVNWRVADVWPQERFLYPPFHADIVRLLQRMASARVVGADFYPRGTQLKLLLTLDGGQRVVFKPKWYDNDFVLLGSPYVGKDRHYAEIAGFHIGRLLQLRRTPLTIGRRLSIRAELLPVMTAPLNATVFVRGGRLCFYGKCYYCKGPETGVCADTDGYLDGALILHLPDHVRLKRYPNPWRRTYQPGVKAPWESQGRVFCDQFLRDNPSWNRSVRLLDLADAAVFDFLVGNADRHHYETLGAQPNAAVALMDAGKGFGNPYIDETSILAPLTQCCMIRQSTWKRISELANGPFSEAVKRLLAHDLLRPVLSQLNIDALDRRAQYIKHAVLRCISRRGHTNVLLANSPR